MAVLVAVMLSAPAAADEAVAQLWTQLREEEAKIDQEALAKVKAARERAAKRLAALRDQLARTGQFDSAVELHAQLKSLQARCARVDWHGSWYSAHVLATKDGQHLVRYEGYGPESDEWVPPARIVEVRCALPAPPAEPPVAPHE
jgi:hypothetical protein